jgi:hypothetical protein
MACAHPPDHSAFDFVLLYISRLSSPACETPLQCAWVHIVHQGNFDNDLTDTVLHLCRFVISALLFILYNFT